MNKQPHYFLNEEEYKEYLALKGASSIQSKHIYENAGILKLAIVDLLMWGVYSPAGDRIRDIRTIVRSKNYIIQKAPSIENRTQDDIEKLEGAGYFTGSEQLYLLEDKIIVTNLINKETFTV